MCSNDRAMENFEKVKAVLDRMDIKYMTDEEARTFRFPMEISSKISGVGYKVTVFDEAVFVCAEPMVKAPFKDKKLMHEVCEMICRMNYGLRGGSFDLDVRDGQILFRYCLGCENAVPSDRMIENAIICPYAMFNRYGDAIADVIFGAASAKDAVARAERPKDEIDGDGDDDGDDDGDNSDDDDEDDDDD